MRQGFAAGIVIIGLTGVATLGEGLARAEESAAGASHDAVLARLRRAVTWLACRSARRGPGTPGIDAAADWIAEQFAEIGLAPPGVGDAFQPFAMTLDAKLGPASANTLELVGPPTADGGDTVVPLVLGRDFTPLAAGGSGRFELPLVFAGYGITAPAEHYDDYAPLADGGVAKGAALVLLRQEPQKNDPHGAFEGNQTSQHAALAQGGQRLRARGRGGCLL